MKALRSQYPTHPLALACLAHCDDVGLAVNRIDDVSAAITYRKVDVDKLRAMAARGNQVAQFHLSRIIDLGYVKNHTPSSTRGELTLLAAGLALLAVVGLCLWVTDQLSENTRYTLISGLVLASLLYLPALPQLRQDRRAFESYTRAATVDEKEMKEGTGVKSPPPSGALLAAQTGLALCYFYGRGVLEDRSKAVELFQEAASHGYPPAEYAMGYVNKTPGRGIAKPVATRAVDWFEKAAKKNHPPALFTLGKCHEYKVGGLSVDYAEALSLYRECEALGYSLASENVSRLSRVVDKKRGLLNRAAHGVLLDMNMHGTDPTIQWGSLSAIR